MPAPSTPSDAEAPRTSARGTVFEIERFALHDGPGIRTMVFLKGCPLECVWCSNPESQEDRPRLQYWSEKCIGCKYCIDACPHGALSWQERICIDDAACRRCGTCARACPTEALALIGQSMRPEDVLREVLKDEHFYRNSGGGVTFSGGEPLAQPQFLLETLRLCRRHHLHTAVETCGHARWQVLEEVARETDLFLFDLKHMDSEAHRRLTGAPNDLLLENFERLISNGSQVVARVPVVPGLNDGDEQLRDLRDFLVRTGRPTRVDLLPYHRLGQPKYRRLELSYALDGVEPPSLPRMEQIRSFLSEAGLSATVGG